MNDSKDKAASDSNNVYFDVSTGLKRIIGRDLIIDEEVAVFELVKNSYDANATRVDIIFTNSSLFIIDNGNGMTKDELKNKWLKVAYSSKKNINKLINERTLDNTKYNSKRKVAGSKGIGRFSSDRLGQKLTLQTRSKASANGDIEVISIDWDLFERNDKQHFTRIPIEQTVSNSFILPEGAQKLNHGTCIELTALRENWDRQKILSLKKSLAKLINPFGSSDDSFKIYLYSAQEKKLDKEIQKELFNEDANTPKELVNGLVGNFIFSTLRNKTTFLSVNLSKDGLFIYSTLTDRGEEIYKIREPNPYKLLTSSSFHCDLYYLNKIAKSTFTKRMGIEPVKFGSVFLFRNGIRVVPIGDENFDWFGINRRKIQGHTRFLGTREIIGRIDVEGSDEDFKEASSRNQGLIHTPATDQLHDFFWNYCIKRLERYVVPVSWADKADSEKEDISLILTDTGKARATAALAKLVDSDSIELISFSSRIFTILNEKTSSFESSLNDLRALAKKTNNELMLDALKKAEIRYIEMKKSEAEALKLADNERKTKVRALKDAEKAKKEKELSDSRYSEEQKRNLFLTSITTLDNDTILNMHHQISIYASDIKIRLENFLRNLNSNSFDKSDLAHRIEQISFLNQKILLTSRIATRANFRLESEFIDTDMAHYIEQYIHEGGRPFFGSNIEIHTFNSSSKFQKKFRPLDVSVLIDNLISNSKKAKATNIDIHISSDKQDQLTIQYTDNGKGLASDIDDIERIFEFGFSRTAGSGIGLYHAKQVINSLNGTITAEPNTPKGIKFIIRISK